MKKLVFILTTLVALSFSKNATAQKSIVDIAVSNEDFSTLVSALKAADLVSALQSEGPFTVFAPTNSAFSKVDSKTLNSLLEPKNKATLSSILTYHVVSGNYDGASVLSALKKAGGTIELKTLSGNTLKIRKGTDGIYLKDENGNYSKITATDVKASNGVIHVIDSVVMPK